MGNGSISEAQTGVTPASSPPKGNPPEPSNRLPRVSVLFRSIADLRILIGQSIPLDGNAIGGADLLDVPLDDHIAELLVQLNSAAGAIGLLTGDQRGAGAAEGVQHQCIAHGMLRWYAVILIQWIQGTGLSHIMNKAIEFKQNNPDSGVQVNGKQERYNDSREHRNVVIADTLEVIENVILFSISNYFLRFSNEYKRLHNLETFQNDWYEYVEYGTTNPLTILLQRSGFSRETSTYIRQHKSEYVVITQSGNIILRRSLLRSRNIGVARESADIQYNVPEIFVD